MAAARSSLEDLNARIVACKRCKRLRAYCAEVARVRRRAYADCEYWGKPVPSFGDPRARVLALGLAPGAHGSNRTGRMFTGDGSGYFFYPVLHEAGFASQPRAESRDDGMKLTDLWISARGALRSAGQQARAGGAAQLRSFSRRGDRPAQESARGGLPGQDRLRRFSGPCAAERARSLRAPA